MFQLLQTYTNILHKNLLEIGASTLIHNSQLFREIYKNAFILVSNDIAKLNEKNLNQIISRKVGQIETILAIVSLIDNKRLIKKSVELS